MQKLVASSNRNQSFVTPSYTKQSTKPRWYNVQNVHEDSHISIIRELELRRPKSAKDHINQAQKNKIESLIKLRETRRQCPEYSSKSKLHPENKMRPIFSNSPSCLNLSQVSKTSWFKITQSFLFFTTRLREQK